MKVLYFHAPWCTACHALKSYLGQIEAELTEIDCESNMPMAEKYHINGLPQFVAIHEDGTEIGRIGGTSITEINHYLKGLQNE